MGLLPLEFTDCLQDSPYFRDSLHSHEKELERTSHHIKELIKEVKNLLSATKTLSRAQRSLSSQLISFKFDCIGSQQTDDELVIAGSLKEFGKLIAAIEDERDRMLERAYDNFIVPLENFRKEHVGSVKEGKRKFDKQTSKFCTSQERYLGLSTKKQDTVLQEADATLEMEQRDFARAGLEYVCLIQEVQDRKKFEFVETIQVFMHSWLTFYHQGHEVAKDFKPYMNELSVRVQNTRENFNSSRDGIQELMRKMLEVRQNKPLDPGTMNKMYTRTGYLFAMEKKALGTVWQKCYCQYVREGRLFCMIPYNQNAGKITSTETFRLKSCIRRMSDSIDKRFCFDVIPEDRPGVVYTLQAQSEEDRSFWLDAMDGKEPMYAHPPGGKPSTADQTFLDEAGFNFVSNCLGALERRGLEDQGLYRIVGVSSKVTKLLTMGLDKRKVEKLNFDDAYEWETKTMTSAVKTYFRNLPEPIMTFSLHQKFIAAAKLETYIARVSEVHRLVHLLPEPNKRMLEILLEHLSKIYQKSSKNLMSVSNLGVVFGPTLLRSEEETVAAIMEIKFANVMVEILIQNWQQILKTKPDTSPPKPLNSHTHTPLKDSKGRPPPSTTSTSPPRTTPTAATTRPAPPYIAPPPPPTQTSPPHATSSKPHHQHQTPTLTTAVIFEGPKLHQHTSPRGGLTGVPPSTVNNGPSYATWERTLRGTGAMVSPPHSSAPTQLPTHSGRSSVTSSMTNLSMTGSLHSHHHQIGQPIQQQLPPSQQQVSPHQQQQLSQHLGQSQQLPWFRPNPTGSSTKASTQLNLSSSALQLPKQTRQSTGTAALHNTPTAQPTTLTAQAPHNASAAPQVNSLAQQQQQQQTNSAAYQTNSAALAQQQTNSAALAQQQTNSAVLAQQQTNSAALAQQQTNSAALAQQQQANSAALAQQQTNSAALAQQQTNSAALAQQQQTNSAAQQNTTSQLPQHSGSSLSARSSRDSSSSSSDSLASWSSKDTSTTHNTHHGDNVSASVSSQTHSPSPPSHRRLHPVTQSPSPPGGSRLRPLMQGKGVGGLQPVELRKVRTLYACVGEHETELSFEPNQVITGVRPSLEPGWLEGTIDGKIGLVPENYVEYIS